MASNKPHDQLRELAAPRELVEWVRKLPAETAARTAWVDAPRADWLPYVAALRGIDRETILRATCACAVEDLRPLAGAEAQRVRVVLDDAAARGKVALTGAEHDLNDLRLGIIAWGHQPHSASSPRPAWMFWTELVLELARASARGNPLVGIALVMRMLATSGGRTKHGELVARLREKLTLGTS